MTSRSSKSNGNNNNRTLNNMMIGDIKIGAKLGQGTFSKVCQGTHMPTGEKVAIKILSKDQIKERSDKIRIEKEINIQKKLHHQNIVQQYAIIETDSTIYIISEYCSGGELFDYIVSKRKLYEVEACRIYQQLISGLEYLHKQRICHRDLKPENLLFDSKHNLKIADFGLSNDYHNGKLSTPCGSPCYAAPEMVTGKKYSGSSVDIWSSGIVLYTMVCGFLPFEDDNQNILFGKIAKGLFSLPSFLSSSCKDLLKKILVTDPKKRYGFEDIKHHGWFMSVNNVMGKNIFFNSPGVFVGEDVMPIDIEIVAEIYNDFHIDIVKIVSDILTNRHNRTTTTYYLILKRKIRNNENSVSDISSNSTSFIKYIKSSNSKMAYWNNDYDKITDYYVKLVKKFLNSISEENSASTESKKKTNHKGSNSAINKDNNINLKTIEIDKTNIKSITENSTNVPNNNDYHCYTELNSKNNNDEPNKNLQNGGMDLRMQTIYDEKTNINHLVPASKAFTINKSDKKNQKMNKNEYEQDSDCSPTNRVNEIYKNKVNEFLQTDANNIKINNVLVKRPHNIIDKPKLLNKLNNKVLKSEGSGNLVNNKVDYENKETIASNIDRILLTEMENVGINNLQKSLLNKNNNLNLNIKDKNSINDTNEPPIRINTLYNKDDSMETIKINTNRNEPNLNLKENTLRENMEIIKESPTKKKRNNKYNRR